MNRLLTFFLLSLLSATIFISCQKEYSLEGGKQNLNTAQGTLKDSMGNCLPSFVEGTYYNGVPVGDTNFLKVVVNFTAPGSYAISTGTQNGFSFGDTGFVGSPGLDTIFLKASGTPTVIQPTDFTITFDSTTCGFTVNVQDSTGTGLGGGTDTTGNGGGTDSTNLSDTAWQFSEGLSNFNGPIDTAYIADTVLLGQNLKILVLIGHTPSTGDSTFSVGAIMPAGIITPGTYTTNTNAFFEFFDVSGNNIYEADPSVPSVVNSIIITSYDPVTKIVTGTFTGTALDSGGGTVTITNGTFKAKVT